MTRAESRALAAIAGLHRELADAYERLAAAGNAEPRPAKIPPAPANKPSDAAIDATRRALRKKGIAA